jgi:Amino acid transporters
MIIGWGIGKIGSFSSATDPGFTVVDNYFGPIIMAVFIIITLNSFFNSALSSFNAGTRTTFAIARDGVLLPKSLAKIHQKYRSPYTVIYLNAILAVILAIPLSIAITPLNAFEIEVTGVTVSYFIYHILTNISLGVYFRRIKELSILKHLIVPTIATVFFAVIMYYSIVPITYPLSYGAIIVLVWAVAGIIISLRIEKGKLEKSELFFSKDSTET